MQEFTKTAKADNRDEDKKCPYYNECYLQVRNSGYCIMDCHDNPHNKEK